MNINKNHDESPLNKYQELENRTTHIAIAIIKLCSPLPKNQIDKVLVNQVVRSSGSIGANYREANEALSKKDFIYRLKIVRKEIKETQHWTQLLKEANTDITHEIKNIDNELAELRKIFSSIIYKLTNNK